MTVLVTGGAGYVGSHAVKELRASGIPCVILDNLRRGHRELALDTELVVGDIADASLVAQIIAKHRVTAVMHFAAFAYVGESMQDPAMYYRNNVAATATMLETIIRSGVRMFAPGDPSRVRDARESSLSQSKVPAAVARR